MLSTRKHPRVPLAARVTVMALGSRTEGDATEIGAGGMSVRCDCGFGISQPVELEFCLPPNGLLVQIAAVIWWKKNGCVGFRFDLLSAHRAVLEQWIEQRIQAAKYFSKPI